jgi:hypothetical protein
MPSYNSGFLSISNSYGMDGIPDSHLRDFRQALHAILSDALARVAVLHRSPSEKRVSYAIHMRPRRRSSRIYMST